jgi:hypothetical protein
MADERAFLHHFGSWIVDGGLEEGWVDTPDQNWPPGLEL